MSVSKIERILDIDDGLDDIMKSPYGIELRGPVATLQSVLEKIKLL